MLFSFEESALLVELEQNPTLQELSRKLGKDASVISRDLKRISEKAPVIEKLNNRWVLTERGSTLALWAKKVSMEQNEILARDYTLTIATTREFASRILAKNFSPFMNKSVRFRIMTCEEGIESALMKGQADFGFDCGKPTDPAIAFKQIIEEEIITVASPKFLRQHKVKTASELPETEFVHYSRLRPTRNIDISKASLASNDIAVIRSLLVNDHGWATLPYYAVKEELEAKKLSAVAGGEIKGFKFGVWWLRGRESLQPWAKEAETWLSQQDLLT